MYKTTSPKTAFDPRPDKIPRPHPQLKHCINLPHTTSLHLRNPKPRPDNSKHTKTRIHEPRHRAQIPGVRVVDIRQDQVEDYVGEVMEENAQTLGFGAEA